MKSTTPLLLLSFASLVRLFAEIQRKHLLIVLPAAISMILLALPVHGVQNEKDDVNPLPEIFGKSRSVQAVPPLGLLSDAIPIVVSPGRRNIQPQLALTYNSMGGLGVVGKGWNVDIGVVLRWRGDGTPTVGDSDVYSYSLSGAGGELRHTANGIYRARIESVYREFKKIEDGNGSYYWVMNNGEGVKHYFGSSANARINGDMWMLDYVEDASGNTITYNYMKNENVIYIDEIWYTGYKGVGGNNRIKFEYESERPDSRISFAKNVTLDQIVKQVHKLRLRSISVFAEMGLRLVRRYELFYTQSPMNNQSLLSDITLVGSNGTSRITLKTLGYTERNLTNSWNPSSSSIPLDLANSTSSSESAPGNDMGARVVDVNGDGFPDIVGQYPLVQSGSNSGVYFGDGRGGFSRNGAAWISSSSGAGSCGSPGNIKFVSEGDDHRGAPLGVELLDVNADMLPDVVVASAVLNRKEVWLNTGKSWQCSATWTNALRALTPSRLSLVHSNYTSTGTQFVDVNGDARADIVWSEEYDGDRFNNVYLNTGSGWQQHQGLSDSLRNVAAMSDGRRFVMDTDKKTFGINQGFSVLDVNGDGLADIIRTVDAACEAYPQARRVYLATEGGWQLDEGYTNSLCKYHIVSTSQGKTRSYGLMPVDFNGDGLVDFIQAKTGPGGDPNVPPRAVFAFRNTGTGWVGARSGEMKYCHVNFGSEYDPPDYCTGGEVDDPVSEKVANAAFAIRLAFNTGWRYSKQTGFTFTDVNGDGAPDILRAMGGKRDLWLTESQPSDLLSRATSAAGEVTSIKWNHSTSLDNDTADDTEGLPVAMRVVKEITCSDGRGNNYTTSYDYGGGLYGYYTYSASGVPQLVRDRRFRGFAWSKQVLPSGLHAWAFYYQDENLAGTSSSLEKRDANGATLTRQSSVYATRPTPVGKQILFLQSDEEMIDPEGTLHSQLKYEYDEKMNVASVYRDPEVKESGNETTTFFTWAANPEAGIWSMPARTTVRQGRAGPVLSEFIMFYDNLPEQQVLKGLPSKKRSLASAGVYVEKSMAYDKYGNVTSIRDGEGSLTTFEYDLTSTFRTRAKDPEGRVVQSQYHPGFGKILRDTDVSGNVTSKEYDVFGRLQKVTLPGDERSPFGTRTYQYSDLGNAGSQHYILKETETPGQEGTLDTIKYFDGMGRVYGVVRDGAANRKTVMWMAYDDADNPVATSRPYYQNGRQLVTYISRDKLHRPISIEEPDHSKLAIYYAGKRTDIWDQRGFKTSLYRNFDARVTEIRRWVGGQEQKTIYIYDLLGRLVEVRDALGSVTRIAYGALDHRIKLEDPNAGTYSYQYDNEGRLISQTDPEGLTTRFRYNGSGDLLRKDFPDGTYHEFTYGGAGDPNAVGRVIRIKDAAGVAEVSYDVRGNAIQRKRSVLGRQYVTGYAYDSLARIRRITHPDGFTVHYEYDSGGNIARITDGQGRDIAQYTNHNAAGQVQDTQFGNGVRSAYGYDYLLRMISINTQGHSGDALQNLQYTYDPAGNIQSIQNFASKSSQYYEYDAIGRLTRAVGPYGDEAYEYDAIGNLLRKGSLAFKIDPLKPQRVLCGIDSSKTVGKEMIQNPNFGACEDSEAAGLRTFRFVYDERGNVIQKGGSLFDYDSENRLVKVRDANRNLLEENVYDASGQLVIQKTRTETSIFIDGVYEESGTRASRHVRAGSLLVATIMTPLATVRLIAEAPPSPYGFDGSPKGRQLWVVATFASFALCVLVLTPVGRKVRRCSLAVLSESVGGVKLRPCKAPFLMLFSPMFLFVNSPMASGAISPLQKSGKGDPRSEMRFYYHSIHLGSINAVTDDRGVVVERRDYKPYGDPFDWTGPNRGGRKLLNSFNGHRYDDATGLYYFGARHYDPETGRFLTADTQVPDPMNPKMLHRYALAGGNPVRYQDPTGHAFWEWFVASAIIATLIIVGIATCGVGLLVGLAAGGGFLAGATFFAIGAAAVGAAVVGIYVARQMPGTDFNWKSFGMALAAGAILGAAAGAMMYALPFSLGFGMGMLGPAMSFIMGLAADALVGAVLGGLAPFAASMAQGGSPEQILTTALGQEMLTGAIKGAIFGVATGGYLNAMVWIKPSFFYLGAGLSLILTAEAAYEVGLQATDPGNLFTLVFPFTGSNWFKNSPPKPLGIPFWTFEGTWLGFGDNPEKNSLAPLLNTMPLVP